MKKVTEVFYSIATTGLNSVKCDIIEIAGIIRQGGNKVGEFDLWNRPQPSAQISPEALKASKVSEEMLKKLPIYGFAELTKVLGKYIDPFNPSDKAILIGYKNRSFDDLFMKQWFSRNSSYLASYFKNYTVDVSVLVAWKSMCFEQKISSLSDAAKFYGFSLGPNAYDLDFLSRKVELIRDMFDTIDKDDLL